MYLFSSKNSPLHFQIFLFIVAITCHALDLNVNPDAFRLKAEQGDSVAQYSYAITFLNLLNGKYDVHSALKWLILSGNKGYIPAQLKIGQMYYSGKEIDRNYTEAIKWFKKAADKGNAEALSTIGGMYHGGFGVTKDVNIAIKYIKEAAEKGFAPAQSNLGYMYA